LFGHEKGAFTGAWKDKKGLVDEAHEGTLFLDEIGELNIAMQAKLLRLLQEGEYKPVGSLHIKSADIRFIAATNRDLRKLIAQGQFREDLFYRLNVMNIEVPPLRERIGDVPLLAQHFLNKYSKKNRKDLKGFTPTAMDALSRYAWPGNVRELENVLERAAVLCDNGVITIDDFPHLGNNKKALESNMIAQVERYENGLIERALKKADYNKTETSRILGIKTSTLYYKMEKYNL
ncbi:sigma 54-interacting transcriptional regulator, partial [bacterium]|nr:sigma 54-interacting transcriptional regulator [bacterium]